MSDGPKDLSHGELVALLQGAAAADARRTERYTKEELLQAAAELRIDSTTAAELVDKYLARRDAVELVPRPFDTRIRLETEPEQLTLTIPPLAINEWTLAPFGAVAALAAFTAFWTHGAARDGGPMALFSIPMWGAVAVFTWRFAIRFWQSTTLTLRRDRGTISTRPFGRTVSVRPAELRARVGDHVRYRARGLSIEKRPGRALLLDHGVRTFALMDGYSDQEQNWVESELRRWLLPSNPI